MSMTSALISVVSAMATSLAIFFRLCAAHRFTYNARTTAGPRSAGCWAPAGEPQIDASATRPAARCEEFMRGTVDFCGGYRKLVESAGDVGDASRGCREKLKRGSRGFEKRFPRSAGLLLQTFAFHPRYWR